MEVGRGARRLAPSSSGCSWAAFEETAKDYDLKSGLLGSSRNPFSPTTRQLCREDMAIYGEEPASESLALVVCEQCGRVVKSQALSKHKDLYHSKVLHIPPPKHVHNIHTVGQPSSAMTTDEPRGQFPHSGGLGRSGGGGSLSGAVMGFAATELPRQNSTSTPDSRDRRGGGMEGESGVNSKTSREYDPNRHCGVWLDDEQRHCTRSLTCKFHPLSQKGRVLGRSRPFAELLEEHRRRKKLKKQGKPTGGHTPSLIPHPSPSDPPPLTAHPLYPTPLPPRPPSTPPLHHPTLHHHRLSTSTEGVGKGERGEWVTREDQSEDDELNDRGLPSHPEYPTPLAVCSFGSRSMRCGSLVFGRRGDRLRSVLATLGGRTKDFTETTLHRKHSYSSLLQQRRERKYFTHKDMFSQEKATLRPIVTPAVTGTFTPSLTPNPTPLPLSPPYPTPTPTTTTTRPSTNSHPPSSVSTPGAEFSRHRNSTAEEPQTPTLNGLDSTAEEAAITGGPPDSGGREEEGREMGRDRRNRDRRKKPRRGRRKQRTTGDGVDSGTLHSEEPIQNHVLQQPPEAMTVAVAMRGDGVGMANLPPMSRAVCGESRGDDWTRVVAEPPRGQPGSRGGGREKGRGSRGSVGGGNFKMVQIKEEPMDEDMVTDHRHVHHTPHKTPTSKPHSIIPNGILTPQPPLSTSISPSPVRPFNAASTARGSPQTFVINPSSGGHPMVTSLTPHMTGLLPIRGSSLQQQHHQTTQPQPPQGFTFGHSLQGLPMQMLNDTLQRRMMQQGAFWLAQQQQQQTHTQSPQVGAAGGGGDSGVPRQQNLVGSPILHSLNTNPSFPQSLSNQSHHPQTHLLSLPRGNTTTGRIRAPISPIPSGIPLHEALHRNLPTPGSSVPIQPSLFGGPQASLHTKQQTLNPTPAAQLPSQRVT